MKIRASLDNGRDKVLSRSSDDNIDIKISIEVAPRRYAEYTVFLFNLDDEAVAINFIRGEDWDNKEEIAFVKLD